jgi:predicted negative regulator of RcsB-dependent stress response
MHFTFDVCSLLIGVILGVAGCLAWWYWKSHKKL